MREKKRLFALLLCVGMAAMLILSSAYLLTTCGHCCAGVHCKICDCAARAGALISAFVFFAVVLTLTALTASRRALPAEAPLAAVVSRTLVGQKVQLNN